VVAVVVAAAVAAAATSYVGYRLLAIG
jgi:hypothetical protein